jgi:hypothetical protein
MQAGSVCVHNKASVLVESVACTIPLGKGRVRVLPLVYKVILSPEEKLY